MPITSSVGHCPHCGHAVGVYLAPREYRTRWTLIGCLACRRDAPTWRWFPAELYDSDRDAALTPRRPALS